MIGNTYGREIKPDNPPSPQSEMGSTRHEDTEGATILNAFSTLPPACHLLISKSKVFSHTDLGEYVCPRRR